MESVGMTEKQKRTMIQAEGGYYCLFTVGLLLTVGMGILLMIPILYGTEIVVFSIYMAHILDSLFDCGTYYDQCDNSMDYV